MVRQQYLCIYIIHTYGMFVGAIHMPPYIASKNDMRRLEIK